MSFIAYCKIRVWLIVENQLVTDSCFFTMSEVQFSDTKCLSQQNVSSFDLKIECSPKMSTVVFTGYWKFVVLTFNDEMELCPWTPCYFWAEKMMLIFIFLHL